MTTLPREGSEPSAAAPHRARSMAESFGTDAQRYDQARPCYPEALVTRIVTGSPGPDVLDVGCGTGIASWQFQAAGCTVLGVEPDARMADFARARGLPVEVATFEAWEPAGPLLDLVRAVPLQPLLRLGLGQAGRLGRLEAAQDLLGGEPVPVSRRRSVRGRRAPSLRRAIHLRSITA